MVRRFFPFFFINDDFFIFPLIEKIKTKAEYKRLFSNFLSLSVLQAANYLFPLITFPYLVRVLGIEKFGLISFAQAFIQYFIIITDYGFNLSATREISIHRDDKEKINEIFSSVMIIKLSLMILSFIFMSIIVFSFNKFRQDWLLYYLTFGMVFGNVLFPVWFFQGIEQMKWITYLNILTKAIFTVAIFVFIKNQDSYYLVPLLNSMGYIIAGVLSLFLIINHFRVEFKLLTLNKVKYYLNDAWYVFISRILVNIYTSTNIILLGFFYNNLAVGYYSVFEKIVIAAGAIFDITNQIIYPYLANNYRRSFKRFIQLLKKIFGIYLVLAFLICFVLEFFRIEILNLIIREYSFDISSLLGVFLIRILFFPFGPLLSNSLIIMEKNAEFIKAIGYTVICNFILVLPSIYFYGLKGLVYSFIFLLLIHILLLISYLRVSIKGLK